MNTVYILSFLGLFCFQRGDRDYFDTSCDIPKENAYLVSYDLCDEQPGYEHVIPESKLKQFKKIVDCEKLARQKYIKEHKNK
jgi:hypothetical protein